MLTLRAIPFDLYDLENVLGWSANEATKGEKKMSSDVRICIFCLFVCLLFQNQGGMAILIPFINYTSASICGGSMHYDGRSGDERQAAKIFVSLR
jgi:hypothetical protein